MAVLHQELSLLQLLFERIYRYTYTDTSSAAEIELSDLAP
jgi:hypothetical protein